MASSNISIFCVTSPSCREFTGHRWIPRTKSQLHGALMFSLICTRMSGWANNREADDLRRHRAHYDVTVMGSVTPFFVSRLQWVNQQNTVLLGDYIDYFLTNFCAVCNIHVKVTNIIKDAQWNPFRRMNDITFHRSYFISFCVFHETAIHYKTLLVQVPNLDGTRICNRVGMLRYPGPILTHWPLGDFNLILGT